MALFKILKGESSRIDTSVTPYHNGYAYFTPDDGGFYIDAESDGSQKRIRINPPSKSISATLTASGWSSKKQTLTIQGITAESNGMIGVAQNATAAQVEAVKDAELYISAQGTNFLTITAAGTVPSQNIPVSVIVVD